MPKITLQLKDLDTLLGQNSFGFSAVLIILFFFAEFVIVHLINPRMSLSVEMSFDKITTCGQIFSAIVRLVLLGDFNAHFYYGDTLPPKTDASIRVFNRFWKATIYINLQIIQRELLGLVSPFVTLSYQTRLAFLFLLVLSVRQLTVITALSMQILIFFFYIVKYS